MKSNRQAQSHIKLDLNNFIIETMICAYSIRLQITNCEMLRLSIMTWLLLLLLLLWTNMI